MLSRIDGWTSMQWKKEHLALREQKEQLRQEVAEIKDSNLRIEAITTLDSLITLPIVLSIVGQIRNHYEKKIAKILMMNTEPDVQKKISTEPLRNIFKEKIGDLKENFKASFHPSKIKMSEMTSQKIFNHVQQLNEKFCHIVSKSKEENEIENFKKELQPLMTDLFFCYYFSDAYEFADDLQKIESKFVLTVKLASILVNTLSFRREIMLNPFLVVSLLSKNLVVDDDESLSCLWEELAIWMQGMHKHSIAFISEKDKNNDEVILQNNETPFVDEMHKTRYEKDVDFYKYFMIKTYDIDVFYKHLSHSILQKLPNHKIPDEGKSNNYKIENNVVAIIEPSEQQHQSLHHSFTLFKDDNKPILLKTQLKNILNVSLERQLIMLEIFLKQNQLTLLQEQIFKKYIYVIVANLHSYRNCYLFKKPTHFVPAGQAISEIKKTPDLKLQLSALFKLWETIKSGNSEKLLTILKESVKELVDILYMYGAETAETVQKLPSTQNKIN